MARARNGNEEKRNTYTILVRKSEGKKPIGRPRRRCKEWAIKASPCTATFNDLLCLDQDLGGRMVSKWILE
jgi:hypothetical protein